MVGTNGIQLMPGHKVEDDSNEQECEQTTFG